MAVFEVTISAPERLGGKSTVYLVVIKTDLPQYQDLGVEEDGLRVLKIRRRYSEFIAMRADLKKAFPKTNFPSAPAKRLFGRFDGKVINERLDFFQALCDVIAADETIRVCDRMQTFLKSAAVEDYQEKLESTYTQAVDLLKLPESEWKLKTEKNGAKISIRELEGSKFFIVKSQVMVDAPKSFFLPIYEDLEQWKKWTGDVNYREIEQADVEGFDNPRILAVTYKLPVAENRDVCFLTGAMNGHPLDDKKDCRTLIASSTEHSLYPPLKGFIRAHLNISITMAEALSEDKTLLTSIVHTDPRGIIPSSLVNSIVSYATSELLTMAKYVSGEYQKTKA